MWEKVYEDEVSSVHIYSRKVIIEQGHMITMRVFQDEQLAKFYAEVAASSFKQMNDWNNT